MRLRPARKTAAAHPNHDGRRSWFLLIDSSALMLTIVAVRHALVAEDSLVYLPAYLAFIYIYRYSWHRALRTTAPNPYSLIACGLSLAILRYLLIFTAASPYLDIFTVATFYLFAQSQARILRNTKRLRWALNAAFLASLACYLWMVADYFILLSHGPLPYLLTRWQLENMVGPVWLLLSIGLFIFLLLVLHVRAAQAVEDFPIRLRLGFLILTWLLFLAFFALDEGVHFGWFHPSKRLSDVFLVLSIICVLFGLAMPDWLERFFSNLTFLDRWTSRELTLYLLTQAVRHSTGSPLTELAVKAAEILELSREERRQIYLACEFLESGYSSGGAGSATAAETAWEELAVSAYPERKRLAAEQSIVFRAWRTKRAVEEGSPEASLPVRLVAAARDYLLGRDLLAYEPCLAAAIASASSALAAPARLGRPESERSAQRQVSQTTRPRG